MHLLHQVRAGGKGRTDKEDVQSISGVTNDNRLGSSEQTRGVWMTSGLSVGPGRGI